MKAAFILFLTAILATSSYARLGETEAKLKERFGEPVSQGAEIVYSEGRQLEIGRRLNFRQDDWVIQCSLIDGRCAKISYGKKGSWTEEQLDLTLAYNCQGGTWKLVSAESNKKTVREWRRIDGGTARWIYVGSLDLQNPAYDRAVEVAKAKAKAAASAKPRI